MEAGKRFLSIVYIWMIKVDDALFSEGRTAILK